MSCLENYSNVQIHEIFPHSLVEERQPLKLVVSGQYRVGGHLPMMFEENFFYIQAGVKTRLNWKRAIRNGCTSEEMWNIVILHQYRIELFEEFKKVPNAARLKGSSYKKSQELVQELEDLEYDLQFFWHFTLDHNFHHWWNRVQGCLCFGDPPGETRSVSKICKLHNSELSDEN